MNGNDSKLKSIRFLLDGKTAELSASTRRELDRACADLSAFGIDAAWEIGNADDADAGSSAAAADISAGVLYLTDSPRILSELKAAGKAAAGYLHDSLQNVDGAAYLIAEVDEVAPDDYEKIFDRLTGRPWTILETARTIVRETAEADADRLYECYDAEALRFLAPLPEREEQLRNMASYREKIYGFYGFGEWSVLDKATGRFIGLMGFEPYSRGEEAVHFGYLLHPDCRGKGIAYECGKAVIDFGIRALGFPLIRAETAPDNEASRRLLKKLGFTFSGTRGIHGKIEEVYEYRPAGPEE